MSRGGSCRKRGLRGPGQTDWRRCAKSDRRLGSQRQHLASPANRQSDKNDDTRTCRTLHSSIGNHHRMSRDIASAGGVQQPNVDVMKMPSVRGERRSGPGSRNRRPSSRSPARDSDPAKIFTTILHEWKNKIIFNAKHEKVFRRYLTR